MDHPASPGRGGFQCHSEGAGIVRIRASMPRNETQRDHFVQESQNFIRLRAARAILRAAGYEGYAQDAAKLADAGEAFEDALTTAESHEPWIAAARLANGSAIWHRLALIEYAETGGDLAKPGTPEDMDRHIALIENDATLGALILLGQVITSILPDSDEPPSATVVASAMCQLRDLGPSTSPGAVDAIDMLVLTAAGSRIGVIATRVWRACCRNLGTTA